MAREVDEQRFAYLGGIRFGLGQIEESVESVRQLQHVAVLDARRGPRRLSGGRGSDARRHYEILTLHGRHVSRQSLQGSAPHARDHIYDEREDDNGENQTRNRQIGHVAVVLELQFAQQIESQQRENGDPQGQIYLAVENAPVVGLVGDAEELKSESQLDESEHHLHRIEPAAALGQRFEPRGEQREERKGQREDHRERQHGYDRRPKLARGGLNEHRSDDRPRARERHEHQRERHEEYARQTALVGFGVAVVDQLAGQHDLESSEERRREDHEYCEEYQIGQPVRGQPVENVGRNGVAADEPRKEYYHADGHRIEHHDEKAVHQSAETAPSHAARTLQEERDGHGDHGEHARSEQRDKGPAHGAQDESPQRDARRGFVVGLHALRGPLGSGSRGVTDLHGEFAVARHAVLIAANHPVGRNVYLGA